MLDKAIELNGAPPSWARRMGVAERGYPGSQTVGAYLRIEAVKLLMTGILRTVRFGIAEAQDARK